MRYLIVATLVALTFTPVVHAGECMPTIAGAEEVVITIHDGRRFKGVLVCVDTEKVTVTAGHTSRTVPRSVIDTIVTTHDSVWNGFAIGATIGLGIVWLGSYEAHLRDGDSNLSTAAAIVGLGGIGALIDAAQHTGGRRVVLPDRGVRVVAWRIRF